MKDRILEFLRRENKSSAQFAEEIGVQASGISHILSGRNNPSLDFILKMVGRYPFISTDWLLFGKGEMYRDNNQSVSLFDFVDAASEKHEGSDQVALEQGTPQPGKPKEEHSEKTEYQGMKPRTTRIVIFYEDSTFTEYHPEDK